MHYVYIRQHNKRADRKIESNDSPSGHSRQGGETSEESGLPSSKKNPRSLMEDFESIKCRRKDQKGEKSDKRKETDRIKAA